AALQYIARQRTDFSEAERGEIAGQVLAVLGDPRFAALFAPGSRAEVPIVGRIDGQPVVGVVDRLAVTPCAILIADYKTNRIVPHSLSDLQTRYQRYIKQLASYRVVLMQLYPDRPIHAALVWTAVPEVGEIPQEALDAVRSTLTTA
ncbi:MAG: ATP-dependent helicase/nuclease subunit, partial [Alphaproteobacteria bacterium]|nr:ATP-dependent helicase/nuclease subunit [Alphaproteobacteria bacterium]